MSNLNLLQDGSKLIDIDFCVAVRISNMEDKVNSLVKCRRICADFKHFDAFH